MLPSSAEWGAVLLTVKVSCLAVLLDLPVALLLARLLVRRRFPGRAALETVLSLPLVLPPVASGLVLVLLLRPAGLLGRGLDLMGWRLLFTWQGAALAAALVAFPLMLRSVVTGFEAVDPRLALVARTLGASRWSAYRRVTLPLALPGILAGCLLAFARALGSLAQPSWWPAPSQAEPGPYPWISTTGCSPAMRREP